MAPDRPETREDAAAKGRPLGVLKAFYASRNPARLKDAASDMRHLIAFCGVRSETEVESILFGPDATAEKSQELAKRYREHQLASGLAYGTINRRLTLVRTLSKIAYTLGIVRWKIEVSAGQKSTRRDTRGVSKPALRQIERMSADSRQARRDRAIILLAARLNANRAELVSLDLEHYHPDPAGPAIAVGNSVIALNLKTKQALDAWVEVRGLRAGPLFTSLDGSSARLDAADLVQLMRPDALGN